MKKLLLLFYWLLVCLSLFTGKVMAQEKETKWTQVLGSSSVETVKGIVSDGDGNTYITGSIEGTVNVILADNNPLSINTTGLKDVFVAKINSAGKYVWIQTYGCDEGNDIGNKIKIDGNGDLIIIGEFVSTVDFNVNDTEGGGILVSKGGSDAFVLKLSALDGTFKWVKSVGSGATDNATGLSIDDVNNIFIGGRFGGTVDFDPGLGISNLVSKGGSNTWNSFVLKLDIDGNFDWAKRIGGIDAATTCQITIYDMHVANNMVYLTGRYQYGVNFNPDETPAQTINSTKQSAFILTLTDAGGYVWHRAITGSGTSTIWANGYGIVTDNSGNVFVVGTYRESVLAPVIAGEGSLEEPGATGDAYVIKFDNNGKMIWGKRIGAGSEDIAEGIAIDVKGDIYATGRFASTVDFGNGISAAAGGQFDAFIVKIKNDGVTKWVHRIGGSATELSAAGGGTAGIDKGQVLYIDQDYNIYTAGVFAASAIFDLPAATIKYTSLGGDDVFIHKLGQPDVLPIHLAYFKGKRELDRNSLSWQTLNENNNSHFVVQRSTDGIIFSEIAEIGGYGNSNSVKGYSYVDYTSFTGPVYYRLLQVDFNGKSTYSEVVIIQSEFNDVIIYPNPFSEMVRLKLAENNTGAGTSVKIVDATGRDVHNIRKVIGNEIILDLSSQPDGLYLIELQRDEKIHIYKVIKRANK